MTQDEIRAYLADHAAVRIQIAGPDDGSPELAWGDTFVYALDADGQARKMPFATIVIKDYDGFDTQSQLNRGGLYRVNLDIGKELFEESFGFAPREFDSHRDQFDFAELDQFFPHPVYGANGWISIIQPGTTTRATLEMLLDAAIARSNRHP
ncbi:DUF6194 family protein [Lysobacter silvisoli]|uniref:Erythromycin esterase n=1 Tax=Lysobacter silvisoli TaxID=2293254 RepID=A0A371K4G8_9GAMM|nr:DUF6194 family protein [Lysobacter silvisoli]RDZ28762.1 erythromycin esterase [Lysobacter silvisoli]